MKLYSIKLIQLGLISAFVGGCGSSDNAGEVVAPASAPFSITAPVEVSVNENENLVVDVSAVGDGAEGAKFTLAEDGDSEYFIINSATGKISLEHPLNFEDPSDQDGDNAYELNVKAISASGEQARKSLTVKVLNVDEYQFDVIFPPDEANLALISDSISVRGGFSKLESASDAQIFVNGSLAEFQLEEGTDWLVDIPISKGKNILTVEVVVDGVVEARQQATLDNYPIPHRPEVTYVEGVEFGISLAKDAIYRRTESSDISTVVLARELGDEGRCIAFDNLQYASVVNSLYFSCRIADVGVMEHFEYSLERSELTQLSLNNKYILSKGRYLVSFPALQGIDYLLIYDMLTGKTGTVNLLFNGESLPIGDDLMLATDSYVYVYAETLGHTFRFSIDDVLFDGDVIDRAVELEVADDASAALRSGMKKLESKYFDIDEGRIKWFDSGAMVMRSVPNSEQLINETAKPASGSYRYLYELAHSPLGRDYVSLVSFVDNTVFDVHVESGAATRSKFDIDLRYRSLGMLEKLDQEGTLVTYNYVTATFQTVDLKVRQTQDIYAIGYDRSGSPNYFSEISADTTNELVYIAPNYGWGGTTDLSLSGLMVYDSKNQELNSLFTIEQLVEAIGIDKNGLKVRVFSAEYIAFENMIYLAIFYSRLSFDGVIFEPTQTEIVKFNPENNTFSTFEIDGANSFSEPKVTFIDELDAVVISGYGFSGLRLIQSDGASELYTPERNFWSINYPVVGPSTDDLFFSGSRNHPVAEHEVCEFGSISVLGGGYKALATSPSGDAGLCFFNSVYSKNERLFYGSGGRGLQVIDELSGSRVYIPLSIQ